MRLLLGISPELIFWTKPRLWALDVAGGQGMRLRAILRSPGDGWEAQFGGLWERGVAGVLGYR